MLNRERKACDMNPLKSAVGITRQPTVPFPLPTGPFTTVAIVISITIHITTERSNALNINEEVVQLRFE